jgi:hypothetical protein
MIDLRFKYLNMPSSSVRSQALAPVEIKGV